MATELLYEDKSSMVLSNFENSNRNNVLENNTNNE